jgi:hypothetical protein
MQASNVSIAGENVALRGIMAVPHRSSRTYSNKRTCAAEGCSTVLSMYNASPLCWQHEPLHPFVLRIERKDKQRG